MPTEHGTQTDREFEINRHASAIMVMIAEAQDEGMIPVTVSSFSDLHSHCDANDFAVDAGLVWSEGAAADLINDVETEVSRRLGVLAGANPGEDDCSVCGRYLFREGTDVAIHYRTPFGSASPAITCTDPCTDRLTAARDADQVLTPAMVRKVRKAYVAERAAAEKG